ncbi:hypothetical protein [Acinetobacter rathckeae]|uniref:hypothetical protein n=1 Tax=Acinetobacter rathckeae TaxID=2605272 RepID=UPI0018A2AB22|nr:hypothetical protein [Acinetobacter rathckeae]MBF7687732.1 hypothetical protein [Acinetobacter rathckeae]MBF7688045.1 hypothetical protein [Acinetobacter rathckeae]
MKPLRLEVLFGAKNSLSPTLKMLTSSSQSAASAFKKTREEIKALEEQQKQIDGYLKQKKALESNTSALQTMHEKLAQLRKDMASNTAEKFATDLNSAKVKLAATNAEIKRLTDQQKKIDLFSSQKKSLLETQKSYDALKLKIKALKQEMQNGSSAKMNKDFATATKQAERFKSKIEQQNISLQRSRDALKEVGVSTQGLAKTQSQLRNTMEQLGTSQTKQATSINSLKKAYDDEKKALDQLSKQLNSTDKEAKKLDNTVREQKQKLQELKNGLNSSGTSTQNLAEHQRSLTSRINQANGSLEAQKTKLKNLNQIQQTHARYRDNTQKATTAGITMATTGAATFYSMKKPIEENKKIDIEQNRIASLGLGKESTKEAIDYARAMKTFGTSTLDNMTLVRDGITAFADVHHAKMVAPMLAKMKFANEAMYGQEHGADNEKKFMDMLKVIEMRNGLKSEGAFKEQANMIQQVITATGGRVQPEEWLNLIKTGGIAAKGVDNKSFYHTLEPLVQEMGGFRVGTALMSSYANLYQGRTTKRAAKNLEKFDLIGDPSKVRHDKTGNLSYLDIGAIKGADLFKKDQFAWMEQVLVPALNKKGITKEGDVIDAIGSIFSNRTASNLIATMYQQRENIHKNQKLNAGADNIDQLNDKAQNTTTGKELEARAKLHDAYLEFGHTILPIYTSAIVTATNAFKNMTGWMQQNPMLAKVIGVGLVGIATSLIAIGGALVVFSPLIMSMLSLRLVMASLSGSGTAMGFVFKMLMSPLKLFGTAMLWLGRIMLANPIILAITVIAGAAYLIYKNWTPISKFFSNIWQKISQLFNSGVTAVAGFFTGLWTSIKDIFNSIDQVFVNNPILNFLLPLIGIPRLIISNWGSISQFFTGLWQTVSNSASSAWNSLTTGTSEAWNSVVMYFSPLGEWFNAQWQTVKQGATDLWASFSSGASDTWNSLTTTFAPAGAWFSERWNDIKNAFNGGLVGVSSLIINWSPIGLFYTAFSSVLSWFGIDLPSKFTGFGGMIIDGLISGIEKGFDKLKNVWTTINSWLPDWTRKSMDIHSPSRVMAGLGGYVVDGLTVGLDKRFPSLKSKFNHVLGVFNQPIQSPQATLPDVSQDHVTPPNKILSHVQQLGNTVAQRINQQFPTLKNKLSQAFEQFKNMPLVSAFIPSQFNQTRDYSNPIEQPKTDLQTRFKHFAQSLTQSNAPELQNSPSVLSNIQPIVEKIKSFTLSNSPTSNTPATIEGDTFHVTFQTQAGQNDKELFNDFKRMIEEYDRKKQIRLRNKFTDQD